MKQNQNGRSMVEMLGVLAIIGVLSIGGIAGYTMAMNRYKANQILDVASKLSIMAQTQKHTEGWNGSLNPAYAEIIGDINLYGKYETTFDVEEDGSVFVYSASEGIQNAIDSITGISGAGIAASRVIETK